MVDGRAPSVCRYYRCAMAVLRAQERPKAAFQARVGAVGAVATVGIALTAVFGVVGAIGSDLLAFATEALVSVRMLRRGRDVRDVKVEEAAVNSDVALDTSMAAGG